MLGALPQGLPLPRLRLPIARLLLAWGGCALAASLAGCATDHLAAAPTKTVDLSGEWQLNLNLSDDPGKPPVDDSTPAPRQHHRGGGRGGGAGGPGGLGLPGGAGGPNSIPPDELENFTGGGGGGAIHGPSSEDPAPTAARLLEVGPPGGGGGRAGSGLLETPERMTITQHGGDVTIQSKSPHGDLVTDDYTVGEHSNVPFANGTADRTVGWRDNIFVVDTKVKSGPEKELDFALDDDGRLIVATLITGRHARKADLKYVYDRVKPGR